ncbi:MAG: sodium/proton-translocating pyrophosphatase, partial [Candidatus Omnitrophica bacterium]|nr:sodium/proton-translocating pyrophosphatase [Candidatus Omnitrophota bacterium]
MSLLWLAPCGSIIALLFSGWLIFYIMRQPEGTDKMKEIAKWVKEGANAYIKRQYSVVAIFFILVFFLLVWLVHKGYLVIFVPFAFLTGGLFSGLSGFIGMKVATASSTRTAYAASKSLNSGLRIAFSSGTVMGLVVVGLGL